MTTLLVDSSVLLKWLDPRGEEQVPAAEALRQGQAADVLSVRMLDLGIYELSNVLLRGRRWPADAAAAQLDDLLSVLDPVVRFDRAWLADALTLAERHGLSGYDAHWAAAAQHLRVPLVSADGQLLAAGLAESAADVVRRLNLPN